MDEAQKNSGQPVASTFSSEPQRSELKTLLIGMDWLPTSGGGGLNRYFYEQVMCSDAAGISAQALVSALPDNPPLLPAVRAMAQQGASLLQRLHGVRQAAGEALRDGVQLINGHFALYTYPALGHLPANVPLVQHFHGPYAQELLVEIPGLRGKARASIARYVERRVLQRAARVITLSEAFAKIARDDYGVSPERIRTIPGGIDLSTYLATDRITARQRLQWPADRPIILCVRRLARRMGLDRLITAMTEVRRAHHDVLLLVAGRGKLAAELQSQIHDAGLDEHVKLLGFVPEPQLPDMYAAADLMVVPTVALEGFGLVTVEALASGTPVLGTNIGGTPEILQGLDRSLIFESTEPPALARQINAALKSRDSLPSPQRCRVFAAQYDWKQVLPRIRAVFEEALAASSANL